MLLASGIPGRLDERVRDRIVAETRGNPLALLELPRGMTPADLAGGFGLPGVGALAGRIEQIFVRRIGSLPSDSRKHFQRQLKMERQVLRMGQREETKSLTGRKKFMKQNHRQ